MTNPDQDVTLDEMARKVVTWISDEEYWAISQGDQSIIASQGPLERLPLSALYTSLDVIREVELALDEIGESTKYEFWIDQILEEQGKILSVADIHGIDYLTADPETRLRAIYETLKEAGEV